MKVRILLVEDDNAILETLSIFLRYEGYEVVGASSVSEALEVLEEHSPDLVLLDYMLKGDTAEAVATELRRRYDDVPLILLTAIDNPMDRAEALQADAMVAKPFELDVLLAKIRSCVESRVRDMTPRDNLLGRGGYDQAVRKEIHDLP